GGAVQSVPLLLLPEDLGTALGDAQLLAVFDRIRNPRGLVRLGVDQHHLALVQGCFDLQDAPRLLRSGFHVALHDVDALDHDGAFVRVHPAHAAALAAAVATDHRDLVTDTYAHHHSTSGARDTIFMK